jgi:hypothetical protein
MAVTKGKTTAPKLDKDIEAWLGQAEKKWQEQAAQAAEEPDFDRVDDGRYIAKTSTAEFTKNNGRISAHFVFVIADGENKGRNIHKWDGLDNEQSLFYLAKTLRRFGYDVDPKTLKLKMIPGILAEIQEEGPYAKIQVKTKADSEYPNIYVNGIAEDFEPEEDEEEEEEGEEIGPGDTVIIEVDGEEVEGEVVSINEKTNKVKVKVGKKTHLVDADDISIPDSDEEEEDEDEESEEEDSEIEVGSRVTDGEQEGEVTKITGEDALVRWDGNRRSSKASLEDLELVGSEDEDEEEEEEEDEEPEIEIGMTVSFKEGRKTLEGSVTKVNEKTGKVSVKSGGKVYVKDTEELTPLDAEEDEEEEEEEEVAPPKRRTAKK